LITNKEELIMDNTLQEEHRRVKNLIWNNMVNRINTASEKDFTRRNTILELKDFSLMNDINHKLLTDGAPTLGMGYDGTMDIQCNLRILRNAIPDAYPMMEEHTYEQLVEAQEQLAEEMQNL
jgi:hypothetical protein